MWKYILAIVCAAIVAMAGKVLYDNYQLKKVTNQLNEQLMEANTEIGKAHTQFLDISQRAKELEKSLQVAIKARDEEVKKYSELWAKYEVIVNGQSNPLPPGEAVVCDAINLIPGNWYLALTNKSLGNFGNPVVTSYQDDRLDIKHTLFSDFGATGLQEWAGSWKFDYKLHLNLKIKMVETIAPTGAINNYAEVHEIDASGKDIGKFEITKYEVELQDQRIAHFSFWNPHLDFGFLLGLTNILSPKLACSIGFEGMSYGLTDNDLSWKFLRLGLNIGKTVGLDFSPVSYNVGGPLPLVSNIWLFPWISYDLDRQISSGIGLSVGL